jgi:hypothetical protein
MFTTPVSEPNGENFDHDVCFGTFIPNTTLKRYCSSHILSLLLHMNVDILWLSVKIYILLNFLAKRSKKNRL